MTTVNLQDFRSDLDKLISYNKQAKPRQRMAALHNKAAAMGAIAFLLDFADANGIALEPGLHEKLKEARSSLREYYEGAWVAFTERPIEHARLRFACDNFVGFNIYRSLYKKKYTDANIPAEIELGDSCNVTPRFRKRIKKILAGLER